MRAATWRTTGSSPADTAMAVLIQPLVDARASGGGLSETAEGQMLISATWGLGSAIAQGEVVPDRIVLSRAGFPAQDRSGAQGSPGDLRSRRRRRAAGGAERARRACPASTPAQAVTLGRMMRKAEAVIGGAVEIEWALDDAGFKLLQARPLHGRADRGARTRSGSSIPGSRDIRPASAGARGAPWW